MGALCPWEMLARYTYGVVSFSEGGSCIITLMTSIELARRCRIDSLSAAHVDGVRQHRKPENTQVSSLAYSTLHTVPSTYLG